MGQECIEEDALLLDQVARCGAARGWIAGMKLRRKRLGCVENYKHQLRCLDKYFV
jgi:hypothetical protein